MPSTVKLLDEIFKETVNYRCEYIDILIKKYVKTEDEIVDIDLNSYKVVKRTNTLKRIVEKPFGYVSSYDCKTAKKTVHCWKKKVILQKRTSFRRYVGVEASDEDYHFTNTKEQLNYLTPCKAYKTLLSVQKDNSYSSVEGSEKTFMNQTDLDDNEHSISIVEEENSFSYDDNFILSGTTEKIQKKVFRKNETIKSLVVRDKNKLSSNLVQEIPNSERKNSYVNLKSSNHKQLEILIEHFSLAASNKYGGNVSKIKHQQMGACVISSSKIEKGDNTISASNVCNNKSITEYFLSKRIPKFSFSKIGMGISSKNCQVSNADNVKLLCKSKKYTETFKSTVNKIGVKTSNKSSQRLCNYSASNKFIRSNKINVNEVETPKKNYQVSNDCYAKLLPWDTKKSTDHHKFRSYENEMETSKNNCQRSIDNKSSSYSTNKSCESSKLKICETEMQASNKASSVLNSISLISAPSNFIDSSTHRRSKNVTRTDNENRKSSLSLSSFKSTSQLFRLSSNKENVGNIDSLTLEKALNDKEVYKKKKSLIQTKLQFRSRKNYNSFLESDCKIDDLSLTRVPSPQKTPRNRRKEACKK